MKARLAAQLFLIISIPIIVQIVQFAILGNLQRQAEPDAAQLEKNKQMTASLLRLQHDVLHIWFNGYRDVHYLESKDFSQTHRNVIDRTSQLKVLLKNDPQAVEFFKTFELHVKPQSDVPPNTGAAGTDLGANQSVAAPENNPNSTGELSEGREYKAILALEDDYRKIGSLIDKRVKDTNQITQHLRILDQNYQNVLLIGALVELLLVGFAALWFHLAIAKRFKIMSDNIIAMSFSKRSGKILKGNDELADLDRMFQRMASKVADAISEEQAVAENATDVICSLDERLAFTDANKASQVVFGYSADELIQRRVANFIEEESLQVAIAHFERAKAGLEEPLEVRIKGADRRIVDTIWSVRWSKKDDSFFCVVHDNSARKENERMRNELVRLISDDLRLPMFGVKNCLNRLKAGFYGELSERGRKYRSNASKATSQMLTLVNDLLDMENVESGALSLDCKWAGLAEIVEQSVAQTSGLASKSGVSIESKVPDIKVFVDRDRLAQVLTNLMSNAVKFSPSGSTVTLDASQKSHGGVEITVADKGRGIPKSALPFIFERFRQTEIADATKKGGSGLGLAICKALIELHGGEITVESVEGQGTTFKLHVPAPNGLPESTPSSRPAPDSIPTDPADESEDSTL